MHIVRASCYSADPTDCCSGQGQLAENPEGISRGDKGRGFGVRKHGENAGRGLRARVNSCAWVASETG
jgi:hypothetical protein